MTTTAAVALAVLAAVLLSGSSCEERVHYPTCEAARSAGAAPLEKGEPGYRSELDRNGDGVACEDE